LSALSVAFDFGVLDPISIVGADGVRSPTAAARSNLVTITIAERRYDFASFGECTTSSVVLLNEASVAAVKLRFLLAKVRGSGEATTTLL